MDDLDNVKKPKKAEQKKVATNKMDITVEDIDGVSCLIARSGNDMHQIDLRAISSWGLLLGLTDPVEIVGKILRFKEKPVKRGEPNLWTPLYETLGDGLDQLSRSGVPAEYMEDVLYSDAPLPTQEATDAILAARGGAVAVIDADPDVCADVAADIAAALDPHTDSIAEMRVEFVDQLAPVYEIVPADAPASMAEADQAVNGTAMQPSMPPA